MGEWDWIGLSTTLQLSESRRINVQHPCPIIAHKRSWAASSSRGHTHSALPPLSRRFRDSRAYSEPQPGPQRPCCYTAETLLSHSRCVGRQAWYFAFPRLRTLTIVATRWRHSPRHCAFQLEGRLERPWSWMKHSVMFVNMVQCWCGLPWDEKGLTQADTGEK